MSEYTLQDIYDFMAGRDASASFSDPAHASSYDWKDFVAVIEEVKVVESSISNYMSGTVVLEVAELDEDGEVVTPAVYYEPTTKDDLLDQISSNSLDVEKILDSYMSGKDWDTFKAGYINE